MTLSLFLFKNELQHRENYFLRTRNVQGNEKQTRATLKGHYVYTI